MGSSEPGAPPRADLLPASERPGAAAAPFPILFTAVGRRCELVDLFRAAAGRLGLEPRLIGADASAMAPALHFCDVYERVPSVDDAAYAKALLEIVRHHGARLVVPLIDPDLEVHARIRAEFEAEGAVALISSDEAVATAGDKYDTWRFFTDAGVPAPAAALPGAGGVGDIALPAVVKPRRGSASKDVYVVRTPQERDLRLEQVPGAMVQELAPGKELTLDVLTDLEGRLINVVVRERIATRGGESSIGVTVARPDVWEWTARIVEALTWRGPITIQCFWDDQTERLLFTEINPRFGGGYPLADAAGANYPELVLRMCLGEAVEPRVGDYRAGLAMSRYDRSVFFDIAQGTRSPEASSSDRSTPTSAQDGQ